MAAYDRTPGVEWTAVEREAVATTLGCKPSAHDAACLTHNMPGNWGNRGHWMDESNDILDALAPFVADRERQAAARALREAAESWSDWDALNAPEDWLRDRAYCEMEAEADPKRYGDVRYVIATLTLEDQP